MLSKSFYVTLPFLFLMLPALVFSEPTQDELSKREAEADFQSFQKILEQVDPSSLHSALHEYSPKKFEHGMFREDATAMKAIYKDSAAIATSIVNLAKRQGGVGGNGTLASSTPTPTPETITESSSPTESDSTSNSDTASTTSAPQETSTSEEGNTSSDASTAPSPSPTTPPTTVTSTSTSSSPSDATLASPVSDSTSTSAPETSESAGSIITSTNSFGVIVVTTVGGGASTMESSSTSSLSSSSSSSSPSATDSSSISSSQSSTAARKLTTSKAVHTEVLSDGSKSTVTAITVVPGDDSSTPTGDAGVQGTGTGSASPGLATGVAVRTSNVMKEIMYVVGGAVGVAMLM